MIKLIFKYIDPKKFKAIVKRTFYGLSKNIFVYNITPRVENEIVLILQELKELRKKQLRWKNWLSCFENIT